MQQPRKRSWMRGLTWFCSRLGRVCQSGGVQARQLWHDSSQRHRQQLSASGATVGTRASSFRGKSHSLGCQDLCFSFKNALRAQYSSFFEPLSADSSFGKKEDARPGGDSSSRTAMAGVHASWCIRMSVTSTWAYWASRAGGHHAGTITSGTRRCTAHALFAAIQADCMQHKRRVNILRQRSLCSA